MRPDRSSLLAEMAAMAVGVEVGMAAFDVRLEELAAGIPSRSDGSSGVSGSSPIESMVVRKVDAERDPKKSPPPDPRSHLAADFPRRLMKAHAAVLELFECYAIVASPRPGVEKLTDPGCELCAQVTGHWCPVYGAVKITVPPKSKRDRQTERILKLCQFCYQFNWPSRAGRLPEYEEVVAHAEGRRPRFTKGA